MTSTSVTSPYRGDKFLHMLSNSLDVLMLRHTQSQKDRRFKLFDYCREEDIQSVLVHLVDDVNAE